MAFTCIAGHCSDCQNYKDFILQVLDPHTGWVQIRPYNQETWSFIRARFKCPFLLMSATMEEKSLQRIAGTTKIFNFQADSYLGNCEDY